MTVYLVLREKHKQKTDITNERSIVGLFQMNSARLRFVKQDKVSILYDAANAARHAREVATS
jgi:hypothetical protein